MRNYLFLLFIIFILFFYGCTKSSKSELVEKQKQIEDRSTENLDTVKIASIFAKSGENAEYEGKVIQYLRLVFDVLNEKGGFLGKQIELLEFDTLSTSIGAKVAAREAVNANVIAAIGALWSSHSMAAAQVFQDAGIVMITPYSSNPKVTRIGDYIFRTCLVDTDQGRAAAHFVKEDLNLTTAAILVNVNDEYSLGLTEIFISEFEKIKGKILFSGEYSHQSADFEDLLSHVKDLSPQVIYIPGRPADIQLILLQSLKMGIKSTFIGGDSWYADRVLDACRENNLNHYFTGSWTDPEVKELKDYRFVEKYKELYNVIKVTSYVVFNAAIVLNEAIISSQSLNPKDIKNELLAIETFEVYQGELSFNEQGDPVGHPIAVYVASDTSVEIYKLLYY